MLACHPRHVSNRAPHVGGGRSVGKDGKALLAGRLGQAVVERDERKVCGPLFGGGQERGKLERIRSAQRMNRQHPIGPRADRL